MNSNDLGRLILTKESTILEKTPELMEYLEDTAKTLYDREASRKGRSYEEVYNSTKKMALEYALVKKNPNFEINSLPHDPSNPHSYAYDVIHTPTGKTIEVKRWKNHDLQKWLVYPVDALNTFLKNTNIIDFLVAARMKEYEQHFEVGFHMVADAKSFKRYIKLSMYNVNDYCYYHYNAIRDGNCAYQQTVNYKESGYGGKDVGSGSSRVHQPSEQEVSGLPES